jgi:hypothetical protein
MATSNRITKVAIVGVRDTTLSAASLSGYLLTKHRLVATSDLS